MKNEHDREPAPDETAGMAWWNSLPRPIVRIGWRVPAALFQADAWAAYKRNGDVDRQPRIVS